jgi:hypothetical protein
LLFIDESHVTIPQIRAMYAGDRSRKTTLVEHGFRLPCALDNRPLKFEEWEDKINQVIFVSATPANYEMDLTGGEVVEQVIRPTGLLGPAGGGGSCSRPSHASAGEIRQRIAMGDRTLVTALTKRLAEDLANFFVENDIKCRWLHSELDAFERVDLLRDLRDGRCEVLVGVNLASRRARPYPKSAWSPFLMPTKKGFYAAKRPSSKPLAGLLEMPTPKSFSTPIQSPRDAKRDRRNASTPRQARGLQRRTRNHSRDDSQSRYRIDSSSSGASKTSTRYCETSSERRGRYGGISQDVGRGNVGSSRGARV